MEQREEGFYLAASRVSLDSIIYAFHRGASPETIHADWPSLSLEQIYGAITYYLANKQIVDQYLRRSEHESAEALPPLSQAAPALYEKLQRAASETASRKR